MVAWLFLGGFQFARSVPQVPEGQNPPLVIEPAAREVIEAAQQTYANVKTIRCTITHEGPRSEISKVIYRRSGGLFIQILDSEGKNVVREYRQLGGSAIVSSPLNRKRYFRYGVDPASHDPFSHGTFQHQDEGGIVTAQLFALPRLTKPQFAADRAFLPWPEFGMINSIRLGARGTAVEGVPVDRIEVERVNWDNSRHAPRRMIIQTVYCVGTVDHLLRQTETSSYRTQARNSNQPMEGTGDIPVTVTQFREVIVNEPIPDSTFVFHPVPGQTVKDMVSTWGDPAYEKAAKLWSQMNEAIVALKSLSFVSDSVTTDRPLDAKAGPADSRRVVTKFDLRRPNFAYGEMSLNNDPVGLVVVSDSERLTARGGTSSRNANTYLDESLPARIRTFDYRWINGWMGFGAAFTLRTFLDARGYDGFNDFCLIAPRKIGAETFDVIEKTTERIDQNGIPDGNPLIERFLIGQKDHLIHGYESDQVVEIGDKPVYHSVRERFPRMAANVDFPPSRFTIKP